MWNTHYGRHEDPISNWEESFISSYCNPVTKDGRSQLISVPAHRAQPQPANPSAASQGHCALLGRHFLKSECGKEPQGESWLCVLAPSPKSHPAICCQVAENSCFAYLVLYYSCLWSSCILYGQNWKSVLLSSYPYNSYVFFPSPPTPGPELPEGWTYIFAYDIDRGPSEMYTEWN